MRLFRVFLHASIALVAVVALVLVAMHRSTNSEIDGHRDAVAHGARMATPPVPRVEVVAALPEPVRRWVAFTFRSLPPTPSWVDFEMNGRFRRPRSASFADTTARQVAAVGTPALVFDATTPVLGVLWARAYDAYVDGHMTMRASLLSALTVVNESSTPALDRTSLRRWLIESSIYPAALLPGGPVTWEPVDANRARAIARLGGVEAALVATFGNDGRLLRFDAEHDGDLDLPYHGSGERVVRGDYRQVEGMMIPHAFVFSRVSGGKVLPFWEGRVASIRFGRAGEMPR